MLYFHQLVPWCVNLLFIFLFSAALNWCGTSQVLYDDVIFSLCYLGGHAHNEFIHIQSSPHAVTLERINNQDKLLEIKKKRNTVHNIFILRSSCPVSYHILKKNLTK